jgi:hypothetical protein
MPGVNPLRQWDPQIAVSSSQHHVSDITVTRRQNALSLFQGYAEKALAEGATTKGLEQAFAATLQISPSMWSQIKSARPIGDKLARQIEALHDKPVGWLDEVRSPVTPSAAELAFVDLAVAAWRATNSAGRRALRDHLGRIVASDPGATGAVPLPRSGNDGAAQAPPSRRRNRR